MNKIILSLMLLVITRSVGFSQSVGIGTNAPDASALLELKATNKGFLPPRMTAAEKASVPAPKAGLMIYQTDGTKGLYVYNGSAWEAVAGSGSAAPGSGWGLTGNSGINPATQFIGTADNQSLKFRVNNINAGAIYSAGGNLGLGLYTLDSVIGGGENNAFGYNALHSLKSGIGNNAFGSGALYKNTSGGGNVAIGLSALSANTTADNNVGVGAYALTNNINGKNNIALSYSSLFNNISGSGNIAAGNAAGYQNQTGNNNITIGTGASYLNESGNSIIAIGDSALFRNSASANMAIGSRALRNNSTGVSNTAIGNDVLYNNVDGNQNTGIGRISLFNNISGIQNTAVGFGTARYNQSGDGNTAIGFQSLLFNVANNNNTAVGHIALASTIADNNTGIGKSALTANNSGASNTAVGFEALASNTTGSYNTAIGYRANTWGTGFTNATAIGANAQAGCSDCVVLGAINGYNGATSNSRVGIGITSPQKTLHVNPNGAGGITIGNDISTGGYTGMNMGISQAAGGYSYIQSVKAAWPSSTYGDLILNQNGGNVGIRTTTPQAPLHVKQASNPAIFNGGGIRIETAGAADRWDFGIDNTLDFNFSYNGVPKLFFEETDGEITIVSDIRMKKDIQPVETALPLVMKLQPKSYHYKDNVAGSRLSYGFIAQEVEKIFPDFVSTKGDNQLKAVGYQKINVMAIKAIQEQQQIIEDQNKKIAALEEKVEEILKLIKK